MAKKKILLVATDDRLTVHYKNALTEAGYELIYTSDVTRALDFAEKENPDAIMIRTFLNHNGAALDDLGYASQREQAANNYSDGVYLFQEMKKRGIKAPIGLSGIGYEDYEAAKAILGEDNLDSVYHQIRLADEMPKAIGKMLGIAPPPKPPRLPPR